MKPTTLRLLILVAFALVVLALVAVIATAPKHPVALLRVVDVSGKPVAGATILPEGLRTKAGPYRSGWYGWMTARNGVPNPPVTTDKDGYARVPYPRFVFERIETGVLCLTASHPDFVPDRPECVVATALPAGAPWRTRVQDLWDRVRHKALLTRPDPIVLKKGATLRISVETGSATPPEANLYAQVSGIASEGADFWVRPAPGVIGTRQLAAGKHTVRAVRLDPDGSVWFSDVVPITAATAQTNDLKLALKRGATVRGQLDDTVPRPVKNGRVVANVWPSEGNPKDSPPQWHAWAAVQEDGSFAIGALPEGELEVVALCDGFVSTNGPGQFHMRYPQIHALGTNDISIIIGMEPTARLEVLVTDENGRPLEGVRVVTSPNVRYGEWSATILMSDCYITSDFLRKKPEKFLWGRPPTDLQGMSDSAGLAVLPNLPADVKELYVDSAQFALPVVKTPDGRKFRNAAVTLIAGQTNRTSIQLEPHERTTITHY